jgi:hypothetical protein
LCVVEDLPKARHIAAASDDDFMYALIICGSPAGKIAGLEDSLQSGAIERSVGIGVMAGSAGRLIQALTVHFAGSKCFRLRRRRLRLASNSH